jgi:hypothetical protein
MENGIDVVVSDFVTPAWFIPGHPGPVFDRQKKCKSPGEILDGGYMSVYDANFGWSQIDHMDRHVPMDHKGKKSRPAKYARSRD